MKDFGKVLGFSRTPAKPGPGVITLESLQALDIAIGRRVGGMLAGDSRSAFAGIGTEFHQLRPYEPGDDVRRIDWNTTARTGEPYVRVELADRVLVTWLVLDASASMTFGTTDKRKADVAEGVAIAIGHLATRRNNRLGIVSFGEGPPRFRQPGQGRTGLLLALNALREGQGGSGSLGQALDLVDGLAAHQSVVVVVVTDFRGTDDWRQPLLRVASRHPTIAVEIRDPREQELADIGELRLADPESGRQVLVDTSNPALREYFATAAAEDRRRLAATLAAAGVSHVTLSTDDDWLRSLSMFLRRGKVR